MARDLLFEASGDISDEMRAKFSDLALSIFTRSTPKDGALSTPYSYHIQ